MSRSPFRRLQNGRGIEQVQRGGDNSVNVQASGDVHFFDIRTASQRARERIETEKEEYWRAPVDNNSPKPHIGEFLRSMRPVPLNRGPQVIESMGKLFSDSLNAAMGPPVQVTPVPPLPPRRSFGDWWARVRTDLGWLPFYNVDWNALAERTFDLAPLDEQSSWAEVEAYGRKVGLLRESFESGDLYPPSIGR